MNINPKRNIVLSIHLLAALAVNATVSVKKQWILPVQSVLTDSSKVHLSKEEVVKIAQEAYIYGLPLVFTDLTRQVSGTKSNVFTHAHKFFDDKNHWVVAPNNDTNYSTAFLDLEQDAVVLTIPDTKDRYFVVPLMDAWTNVFASFGKRNTGTGAQKYLITGPKWKGIVPSGLKQVKSPTDMVWVIGRIQVNSPEDQVKFVSKIQDQFTLATLSSWAKNNVAGGTDPVVYHTPLPVKAIQDHQLTVVKAIQTLPLADYFNYLNELMVKNPPLVADAPVLAQFAKLGIQAGGKFDIDAFDQETKEALNNLPKSIFGQFDTGHPSESSKPVAGAKIGDYKTDYLLRALVAYKGLGALTPEEATYVGYVKDADKNLLDGKNAYVIHFDKGKLPPAKAFWSLTMYDSDRYLVDNPIKRYAIGDRNPLIFNTDGSLDIYLQHENPGAEKENNWLPAPADNFNVILRIYVPEETYLKDKNTWLSPPVKKITP
ncbi:DUF1254 domain-containing protein [Pedobacter sp. L105]|uniref:DUF1254 domain-containing protein n=1 Tax=Pedobacter sp. L105 TaxID=1641871 RepID=UPI00131BCBD4|nr:DUF1254 domain-containing protein [Pedobacter sp. L105]